MYEYPIIPIGRTKLNWYEDNRFGNIWREEVQEMMNNHDLGKSFFCMWF